jgi:small-conductance mechanosensitive channel
MAYYAAAGSIASVGLAALAIATGFCVALGWRSAVKRRFPEHRRWMWRTFLLLCSAIILRLIGGLATVTSFTYTWVDPLATWMSWLLPIAAFEYGEMRKRGRRRRSSSSVRAS